MDESTTQTQVRLGARLAVPSEVKARAVYTASQLLGLGVSRCQLRGPSFHRLMYGVYSRADNPILDHPWVQIQAAVLASGGQGVVSGLTALRVWRVQLPDRFERDNRIHLTVERGKVKVLRSQVVCHRLRRIDHLDTALVQGVVVMTPIEAWAQTARSANHEELVQIGDGLMRYTDPICDPAEIARFLGRSGADLPIGKLTRALQDMRPGTDSIRETCVRRWIVGSGLPEPKVNEIIADANGHFLARGDCYMEGYFTLAEYDGDCHDTQENRLKDNTRRRALYNAGYEVVTATKADLANPMRFLRALEAALERQARRYGFTAPRITRQVTS